MANFARLYTTILSIILMLSFYSGYGSRSSYGGVFHLPMKRWCIAKAGTSDDLLQSNIDFACARADCGPIQVDQACYYPLTNISHASFAMNSYYHTYGIDPINCDFNNSGRVVFFDPSYRACTYPPS